MIGIFSYFTYLRRDVIQSVCSFDMVVALSSSSSSARCRRAGYFSLPKPVGCLIRPTSAATGFQGSRERLRAGDNGDSH